MYRASNPSPTRIVWTHCVVGVLVCALLLNIVFAMGLLATSVLPLNTSPFTAVSAQATDPTPSPNCHNHQAALKQHTGTDPHINPVAECCAWICSGHALLPTMAIQAFAPPSNLPQTIDYARVIATPQLPHLRSIERPPRLIRS